MDDSTQDANKTPKDELQLPPKGHTHESSEVGEVIKLYENAIKTLVLMGYTDLAEMKKAFYRNLRSGYNFLHGQEGHAEVLCLKVLAETQDTYDVWVHKIAPTNLQPIPRCPIFYACHIIHNGIPPVRYDYDLLMGLICQKDMCTWWSKKSSKCGMILRPVVSSKTLMDLANTLRKPLDYIVHQECLTCGNWDTPYCKTCAKVPVNYKQRANEQPIETEL